MRFWKSLSSIFPTGRSRTYAAHKRLTDSYRDLFTGHGGKDEAQIVLADLANASGFYRVSGPNITDGELRYQEGQRAMFARIFGHLSLSDDDLRALENAARTEAAIDAQQPND